MRASTRLTTKGQVVIPKSVRTQLRWRPGRELSVETTAEGAVLLTPLPSQAARKPRAAVDEAYGFLTGGDPLTALEREHRAEIKADERRRRP